MRACRRPEPRAGGMSLARATLVTDALALALVAAGGMLLARLRHLPPGSPAAYGHRIAGTMALMLGAILLAFATAYALAGGGAG